MSGICSAHQGYDADCRACNAMPIRVYMAAPFALQYLINSLAGELRRAGIEVVSRWHDPKNDHGNWGKDFAGDRSGMNIEAEEDLEDIRACDVLIAFTQPPKTSYTSGGRHVEFGYALALGKTIYVVGPIENVFTNLAKGVFETWDLLLAEGLKIPPTRGREVTGKQ